MRCDSERCRDVLEAESCSKWRKQTHRCLPRGVPPLFARRVHCRTNFFVEIEIEMKTNPRTYLTPLARLYFSAVGNSTFIQRTGLFCTSPRT